ncbi:gamma-glutamyltransferase [Sphingomonas solaris]|uniref:Glutathione hydrolase proenzyme n=1 Tax=Alterirhizorhabdus solaris TaxID=2529389 RepID=A0A558RCN9_9SPHN|nr:gamma-glutamyltransferase [Sphingomonas solaris]TVV77209.1 gamma-glutamyltransferase [Sphingomonas solaris]
MIQRFLLSFVLFLSLPAVALAKGGVVSAADPRAAAAGQAMLRAGGTATDAAMATMIALTVVEPQSSGIGGGGFLVHSDARGQVSTIDGRETAPAAAGPRRFLGADGKPLPFVQAVAGGLSVGVPGNVRLMAAAHRRWGRLPWATLFEPAIALADGGFAATPRLVAAVGAVDRLWGDFPAITALYHPGGKPPVAGATLRNPALARLLRTIAQGGADAFYTGPVAASITTAGATAKRNPSALTAADLAGYEAKERPAVCAPYRTYRLCGMGPPSAGAMTVLQILGLLERFDMKALGPDNPISWHLIGEAMQLAYADRDKYLGDTDFVAVPLAGLLDKRYIARRALLIDPASSLPRYEAGTPPGAAPRTAAVSSEVPATTNFVTVDGQGDVVTMTSTVEGPFGSQIVTDGMVLNNELTDFSFAPEWDGAPVANRVEAGKRPLSSMAPTIVYDARGRVVLALGSAGGRRIPMHVLKTLVGVLDWGLPVADAIALPNIYFGGGALLVERGTSLAAMKPALERLGQTVVVADVGSKVNAIERTATGWRGAADPRSEGVALAE